ncbi:MAG: nucleotide exchange factor GrpE, partial [Burkholderiales bacterium]|nr:nucleotide exchange factor GrpE [Burkholderiales bacterium]
MNPTADTPDNGAEAGAQEPQSASAQARLAELEAKHAEVSDAYLRAKAETENIRRRS